MTAQAGDKFSYKGKDLYLVARSVRSRFSPIHYKIKPEGITSGCYEGYWCRYNITNKKLFLEDLYINSENGEYPPINGVAADYGTYSSSLHCYKGIHDMTSYSGKLLLGDDFIDDYYVHMGSQWPWAFKTLKEFVFERGKLVKINDQSEIAAHLREVIGRDEEFFNDLEYEIGYHVEECFSHDYFIKAWWLPEGDFEIRADFDSATFFLQNNRSLYGNNLIRDVVTDKEHPGMQQFDNPTSSDDILEILKRKKVNSSKLRKIDLYTGFYPIGNIDGILDFCESAREKSNAKVVLHLLDLWPSAERSFPLESFEGKIDSVVFRIHPNNIDGSTFSNAYEAIFGEGRYEMFSTLIPELKKYIPEIVIDAYTRKLNEETIKECRQIVEDELQVTFKNW